MNKQSIKIDGNGIKPSTLDSAILGKILVDLSKLSKENNGNSFRLVDLKEGSCELIGISDTNIIDIFEKAISSNFEKLSHKTIGYLRNIKDTLKTNNLIINFDTLKPSSVFSSKTILPKPAIFRSYTNITGKVVGTTLNSKNEYTTRLKLVDGEIVTCVSDVETFQSLGKKLLSDIVVFGIKSLNSETDKITRFAIESFQEYKSESISEVIDHLSEDYSEYYDIINPDDYFEKLRNE